MLLLPKISGSSGFYKGPLLLLPLIFGSNNISDKNSKIGSFICRKVVNSKFHWTMKMELTVKKTNL